MDNPSLNVLDGLSGIAFVPMPVEALSDDPKLHDEVGRQVLRLGFARFSRQRRSKAFSSPPMMIRASEPPMKERLFAESARLTVVEFMPDSVTRDSGCIRETNRLAKAAHVPAHSYGALMQEAHPVGGDDVGQRVL
jgi:hypothetical protein